MVGTDQTQMDLFPLDSVTVITHLHLMASDAPLRRPNVWTLVPPNSISCS